MSGSGTPGRLQSAVSLATVMRGRDNNFNLIRLMAAVAVLCGHSYPLTQGRGAKEPLVALLGQNLGGFAVDTFFFISGLLVCASLYYRQSGWAFLKARLLRIYPGLWVMLLITVGLLGGMVSRLPVADFWRSPEVLGYLSHCGTLIGGVRFKLPGLFADNPFPDSVNGSLWTLPYEVRLYAWLLALWILSRAFGSRRLKVLSWIVVGYALGTLVFVIAGLFFPLKVSPFIRLSMMFALGASAFVLKDQVRVSWVGFALAFGVLCLSAFQKSGFMVTYVLLLPYLILCLAYLPGGWIRRFNQLGDYSYGVYIYAFPIQQALVQLLAVRDPLTLTSIALPVTLAFAMMSWHLVESPALGLKGR